MLHLNQQDQFNVTLVIPSYKESERLPFFLESLTTYLPADMKIIIVDDGSPESDFQILKSKIAQYLSNQIELVRYETNRGKGGAIEYGLEKANTKWLGFLDADGSIPPHEVRQLWSFAKEHADTDVILSTRIKLLGKSIERTFKRHLFGRIFVTYLNFLFDIPVYDSQCGYKIFKKSVYVQIKKFIINKRWLWDTELVILSYKSGFNCIEVPIDWKDIPGSKIHLISDSLKMATGLYRFKNQLKVQLHAIKKMKLS